MQHCPSNARRSTLTSTRRLGTASAALLAAALLAACGGGGTSSAAQNPVSPPVGNPQSTQSLGITFAGTQTLAAIRRPQDLASTPVTVTVNGVVVGTGTLDGNGHAKIAFTVSVAPGATIVVKAGQLTVTTTIATTSQNTAALVTVNADGTITVTTAADPGGNGLVDSDDPEHEVQDEDGKGHVTSVTANDGNVLPANAPFSLLNACGTITLTPTDSAVASIKFEEKASDGDSDDAGRVRFEGAFTGPLHFPVAASSARLHIEIFNAQHQRLIEVKAPIGAFTSGTSASPCPAPSATSTASGTPEPSPTGTSTSSPRPSPTVGNAARLTGGQQAQAHQQSPLGHQRSRSAALSTLPKKARISGAIW
jgi:hypothetical protein